MIEIARPALAAAGLGAALVPLVLHLIARQPRERVGLPTARFLEPDPRVAVRIRRRPTDPLLLALRMLLLVLAGLALAGPVWHPDRDGTAEVVLLDRGRAMRDGDAWPRAVAEARRRLLAPDGEVRGDLVLFDTAAVHYPGPSLTAARFDSLATAPPADVPSDYAVALRALAAAGRTLRGTDSARATLLTIPRWEGWRPGMAAIRRAAWPGALELPPFASSDLDGRQLVDDGARRRGAALVVAGRGEGVYVTAALEATGWSVIRSTSDEALDTARLIVVVTPPSGEVAQRIGERVRAGATLLSSTDAGALAPLLPWRGATGEALPGGSIWFRDGPRLERTATRAAGRPAEGATVLAAWDDGLPAAVAAPVGEGCAVVLAAPLEGGALPLSADYPRALDRLANGCAADASADVVTGVEGGLSLDSGAVAMLRLADRPPTVAASAGAGPGGGVPLWRWVFAAALLVALAETALAYGRRRRGGVEPAA